MEGNSAASRGSCSDTISNGTDNLHSTDSGCSVMKEFEGSTVSGNFCDWDRVTAHAGNTRGNFSRAVDAHSIGSLITTGLGKTLPPAISFPRIKLTLSTGSFLHTPNWKTPVARSDFISTTCKGTLTHPISIPRTKTFAPVYEASEKGSTSSKMKDWADPVSLNLHALNIRTAS